MISIYKFLNLERLVKEHQGEDHQDSGPVPDNAPDLSQAAVQALRLLIEGLHFQKDTAVDPDGRAKHVVADLLRRLEAPLQPFDVIEIATDAVSALEEDSRTAWERHRQNDEQSQAADQLAELSKASLQALRMLLGGWPLASGIGGMDGGGKRAIAELLRRLEGPLVPFDVLEIAGDALTALEQDAKAARDGQRQQEEQLHLADQQAEFARSAVRALQILLEALPLHSQPDARLQRVIAELLRRSEGQVSPLEVVKIAREAVAALEQNAKAGQDRSRLLEEQQQEEQQREAAQRDELSSALLGALRSLVTGLSSSHAGMDVLLHRLEGPLAPAEVSAITNEALAAIERDAETMQANHTGEAQQEQFAEKQEGLSKALLQALQMVLGNWPHGDGESGSGRVMAELLRRLEQPLVPFDVLEIASDAVTAFDQEAKAALDDSQRRRQQSGFQQADLLEALLQALRLLLGGLPLSNQGSSESDASGKPAITALLRRLEEPLAPFDVLEIANEALTALDQDTKATRTRYQLQSEELQAMISMLTETVAGLSVQRTSSVTRLQQIERRIEQASLVEDLRSLKSNLSDCLQAVREASANQQKQSAETIQRFERQIQTVKTRLSALPRTEPEEIVQPEVKGADPKAAEYSVVFLLDRESSIAIRFGEDVRHSILRFVNQHLKEALMPADRLVRWKGAAFLASVKRTGSIQDLRAELSSVAVIPVPPSLSVGNRSIRLPISLSWAIFPQARYTSLDLLFGKVDEFIAKTQGTKTS